MFIYIDLRRRINQGLRRQGRVQGTSEYRTDANTNAQKKNPDVFTSGFLYQLLPCTAGAAFSTLEYFFFLDLVLGRVMYRVYGYISSDRRRTRVNFLS